MSLLLPAVAAAQKLVTGSGPGTSPFVRVIDASGPDTVFFAYYPAFTGGVHVAAGDVNGDGKADIITGAGPGGGPHVQVFSGADLSLLASFFAYGVAFTGGVHVAAGDVNGDGLADIITGAGPGGGPHVQVFSGANLSLLASFFAYDVAFTGGVNVAVGDVNNDGLADIITGAGPGGGPHVKISSGRDLSAMASFLAYDPAFRGGVNVGAGDFNGDGRADIVTGAGPGGGPHVRILNAVDLTELAGFLAFPGGSGGVSVGAVGDSGLRFSSPIAASFGVSTPGTFTVTTIGVPTPALTVTGALPAGVTFVDNGNGTGRLAGTPQSGTAGTYALSFTATRGDLKATQSFTFGVTCPLVVISPPSVGTVLPHLGPISRPQTPLGSQYSESFTASGGFAPYTFSLASGNVPPGLSLASSGLLFGTSTQLGTFDFVVRTTDTSGCSASVSRGVVVTCPTITITPDTVPHATAGSAYGPVTFAQTGSTTPVTWSVSSGSLPTGLTLAPSTGVLSGTTNTPGTFNVIVTAATASGCTGSIFISFVVQP